MEVVGLIIAVLAVIIVICLNSKLNKISSASDAKIQDLKNENQKLSNTINEQNEFINSLKRDLNNASQDFSDFSKKTGSDINSLTNGIEANSKAVRLLKQENESLKETIAKQNEDIKKLTDAIKNYTDIKADSLMLNVSDDDEVPDAGELVTSVSKSKHKIEYEDLDPEKQEIYELMENSNANLFITGKAGTGKSYLLKYFRQNTSKNALYTAPTGISALNIEGVTLHRTFGFNNLQENQPININKDQKKLLKKIDTLVIDEISMVRADTFNRINMIFQEVMENDKPFGGKQIIVLGDLFQLPPVAKRDETEYLSDKYGGIYFFNSPAYKFGNFAFRELQNIHRQSEKQFIDILNRAREGKLQAEDVEEIYYGSSSPRGSGGG